MRADKIFTDYTPSIEWTKKHLCDTMLIECTPVYNVHVCVFTVILYISGVILGFGESTLKQSPNAFYVAGNVARGVGTVG